MRARLVASVIDDKLTVATSTLSIAIVASLVVYLSGALWPFAWLAADLAISGVRLAILFDAERRDLQRGERHQSAMMLSSILWTLVFAAGLYGCFASNMPAVAMIGAVYAVAVAGTIASHFAALPRLAGIIIVLCYVPFGLGLAFSELPGVPVLAVFVPLWTAGMLAMMVQNYRMIARTIRAELQARRAALTDRLTALPNRMFLEETMLAMCGELDRGRGFAVLCLDLDGFKEVNDRYGHGAGDLLLKAVAARMENVVRGEDKVCRLGGDEFVVLLPDAGTVEAAAIARRIIEVIERSFDLGLSKPVDIGISIGSVIAPDHGRDPMTLLEAADRALYSAKSAGKGVHRPYLAGARAA